MAYFVLSAIISAALRAELNARIRICLPRAWHCVLRFFVIVTAAACASALSACSGAKSVSEAADMLNQSVINYQNCLAKNAPNVNACERERQIMQAEQKVLSQALAKTPPATPIDQSASESAPSTEQAGNQR